MPYEVSMAGGQPWGFRLSGGLSMGTPCTISRITPGGKAAQANVMQGDILVAVNGTSISDLDLPDVMQRIKYSGEQLHLTLLSQDEIMDSLKKKRQSELNITSVSEMERPSSNLSGCMSPRFVIKITSENSTNERKNRFNGFPDGPNKQQKQQNTYESKTEMEIHNQKTSPNRFANKKNMAIRPTPIPPAKCASPLIIASPNRSDPNSKQQRDDSMNLASENSFQEDAQPESVQTPTPKPRNITQPAQNRAEEDVSENFEEKKRVPDYIKRHLKPQKPVPEFKPQVNWLRNKLKINMKGSSNAISDPGNKLKSAAQAHPNQPIEIEGPLSATVVHAQYNTPVGLYSGSQIVNTLVGTAAAKGAKVTDPEVFGESVDVNKETPVYKLVHQTAKTSATPAQSRSIQILDALLSQPGATLPSAFQ